MPRIMRNHRQRVTRFQDHLKEAGVWAEVEEEGGEVEIDRE